MRAMRMFEIVLPVIVHEQRLGAAFALVVARADADRIDMAPVGFRLRMDVRIAIDFAGRRLQDAGLARAWPGPAC